MQFLLSKNINVYKLTKKGRTAAVGGISAADFALSDEIFGTVNLKTFATMMHYEQERIKNNPALNASVVIIYIENIFDLYRKIGKSKERELLAEFVNIVRDGITPADFICINNPSVLSICINDAPLNAAQLMVMKITDKLEELVYNNFESFALNVLTQTVELSKEQSFDKQLHSLIKEIVEKG